MSLICRVDLFLFSSHDSFTKLDTYFLLNYYMGKKVINNESKTYKIIQNLKVTGVFFSSQQLSEWSAKESYVGACFTSRVRVHTAPNYS